MSSLSLQQTRTYIDKLGDLENELIRTCRVAEIMAKDAGKELSAASARLKEACDAAREQGKYVSEAKNRLLEFDGFLHAQSHAIRESLERPHMASYLNEVGGRMGNALESHVEAIGGEAIEALRRIAGAIKDVRDAKANKEGEASAKASAKALAKICDAAEKAIREGVKGRKRPEPEIEMAEPEPEIEMDEEVEVEKMAHGYNLTAGLPPEFLENAQKKKDEAKAKKDDEADNADDDEKKSCKKAAPEHGYNLTAESRVPGNESKGPKEEGEEDEGWVPGHRTKDKGKEAAHGYGLRA
jgi:hypothetical protein